MQIHLTELLGMRAVACGSKSGSQQNFPLDSLVVRTNFSIGRELTSIHYL
jgi:hypothetical protein